MLRNTVFNGNYVLNVLGGYELRFKRKKLGLAAPREGLSEKQTAKWQKKQTRKSATSLSLKFDVKFTLAGGSRFTPIDLEASAIERKAVYIDNQAFSSQFDPYYRLDLGLTFRMSRKRVTQEFSASCQNVTDKENPLYKRYDAQNNRLENVNQLGIYPLLQYRITF